MVHTKIERDPRIDVPMAIFNRPESINPELATETFENCGLVIVDNVPTDWPWVLQPRANRTRKTSHRSAASNTEEEVKIYHESLVLMREIRDVVFPWYKYFEEEQSSRLLIVGPESMHFDTFWLRSGETCLMAIFNVDDEPRIWEITWSFPRLIQEQTNLMREIYNRCRERHEHISMRLRAKTMEGDGYPRWKIEFSPKCLFFFNPNLLSHRIVYGGGAVILASHTMSAKCLTQHELLKKAFGRG